MSTLAIILLSIFGFFLLNAIGGFLAYRMFAVPAYRSFTPVQRTTCVEIVKSGKGFPWLCAHAVKIGKCPCMPCTKQAEILQKRESR